MKKKTNDIMDRFYSQQEKELICISNKKNLSSKERQAEFKRLFGVSQNAFAKAYEFNLRLSHVNVKAPDPNKPITVEYDFYSYILDTEENLKKAKARIRRNLTKIPFPWTKIHVGRMDFIEDYNKNKWLRLETKDLYEARVLSLVKY